MDDQNLNQQVPPVNTPPVAPVPPVAEVPPAPTNPVTPPTPPGPKKSFMETLEYYFVTKAPFQLPVGLKDFIVKICPWGSAISLLASISMVIALFTITAVASLSTGHFGVLLHSILLLVAFVLGIIALPGLFKRKMSGWKFLLYEAFVYAVASLIYGNVIGAIIGLVIGLYILFQVKSYYN